jgi:hypothetical protein
MVSGKSFSTTKSCGNVPTNGPSALPATFPRRRHPHRWVLPGAILPGQQGHHPTSMSEPTMLSGVGPGLHLIARAVIIPLAFLAGPSAFRQPLLGCCKRATKPGSRREQYPLAGFYN